MKKLSLRNFIIFLGLSLCMTCSSVDDINIEADPKEDPLACALLAARQVKKEAPLRIKLLKQIAAKYAETGQFDHAIQFAKATKYPLTEAEMLTKIATEYAKARQKEKALDLLSQALTTADTINFPSSKSVALTHIASGYAQNGQKEKASELLSQAHRVAEKTMTRNSLVADIAVKHSEIGQYERALQITKTIRSPALRAEVLGEVSARYMKTGQLQKATDLLCEALQLAEKTKGGERLYKKLISIAVRFAKAGHYEQALKISRAIKNSRWQVRGLTKIASEYAETGQRDKASGMLSRAFQLADTIDSSSLKAQWLNPKWQVLSYIAGGYTHNGQKDKASNMLFQALDVAEKTDYYPCKSTVLACIASDYAHNGQMERASGLLSQAFHVAETIKDPSEKGLRLALVAWKYAEVGQYSQAVHVAKTIGNSHYRAEALANIALHFAEAGRNVNDGKRNILYEIAKACE